MCKFIRFVCINFKKRCVQLQKCVLSISYGETSNQGFNLNCIQMNWFKWLMSWKTLNWRRSKHCWDLCCTGSTRESMSESCIVPVMFWLVNINSDFQNCAHLNDTVTRWRQLFCYPSIKQYLGQSRRDARLDAKELHGNYETVD